MPMFLTDLELSELTGRRSKSYQIQWLRANGIPFRINAAGRPVVASVVVEGIGSRSPTVDEWRPAVLFASKDGAFRSG